MPRWKEKRAQRRFVYELPVQIRTSERAAEGRSLNISLGGMLFESSESFPFGTKLQLRFRLPALDVDTQVEVTVRWNRDSKHGVQFGSMRARDVWALNRLFKSIKSV